METTKKKHKYSFILIYLCVWSKSWHKIKCFENSELEYFIQLYFSSTTTTQKSQLAHIITHNICVYLHKSIIISIEKIYVSPTHPFASKLIQKIKKKMYKFNISKLDSLKKNIFVSQTFKHELRKLKYLHSVFACLFNTSIREYYT